MTDEIKEIKVNKANKSITFINNGIAFSQFGVADEILDLITNLQEKLKVSQTNEETYGLEMQDITKCLGLKDDTIFDEVKEYATNLQEELERYKHYFKTSGIEELMEENEMYSQLKDEYEDIIEKAIEYIKGWQSFSHTNCTTHNELKNLLEILQGVNNDV